MHKPSAAKRDLSNIQMLRAGAALNVVLFHAIGTSESYGFGWSPFTWLKGWGANGVDVFFVISGFIMVYVQTHKNYSPPRFFLNRVVRIVPLYWTLTTLFLALYVIAPSTFRQVQPTIEWTAASFFFLSEVIGKPHPILLVGWTLEFEMLFYLIFSFSLLLKQMKSTILLSAVLIGLFAYNTGNPIVLEFIFGMAIGFLCGNKQYDSPLVKICLYLGLVLLAASIPFGHNHLYRVLVWGVPAALIVFALVNLPQYKISVLQKLGDASYSIYLVQIFTLPACYKLLKIVGAPDFASGFYIALSVFVTALAGYLTYAFYESKISLKPALVPKFAK